MDKKYQKLYKLVGVLETSDDLLGFVYPVFQGVDDKKYYAQDGDENFIIRDFLPVNDTYLLSHVTLTNNLIKSNCKQEFVAKVLSDTLFCFKTDENSVQVGTYRELKEFFKTYKCRNSDLMEQIDMFLNWRN